MAPDAPLPRRQLSVMRYHPGQETYIRLHGGKAGHRLPLPIDGGRQSYNKIVIVSHAEGCACGGR